MVLFISGKLKQNGNGTVTSIKVKPSKPKDVPFDWDAPPTRKVTYADIMKQPSMYEI